MYSLEIDDRINPYLCVYASQAAACIGDNRHKKICDAVDAFWERAHSHSYKAAMKRNVIMTSEEIINRLEKNHPKIAYIMKVAGDEEETSTDVAKKYGKLSSEFTKYANLNYISHEFHGVVDDAIRKTTYTAYGNAQESKVFDYVRETLGIDADEDLDFYKSQAGVVENEHGSFPWFIGGKIDGITRDRRTLIEIKNRVNRLFRIIPQYESIQVQVYLQLLGLDKAILVECLKTKEHNVLRENVNVISVNRDSEKWEADIAPRLEGFVDFVIRLIHDEDLQNKYLKSKRRSAIVSSHITSYSKAKKSA